MLLVFGQSSLVLSCKDVGAFSNMMPDDIRKQISLSLVKIFFGKLS